MTTEIWKQLRKPAVHAGESLCESHELLCCRHRFRAELQIFKAMKAYV